MSLFHQPLFSPRLIAKHAHQQPTPPRHKKILHDWAQTIRSQSIDKQKESEIRGPFIHNFFVEVLGYTPFGSGMQWTINDEKRTGTGSADTSLGVFDKNEKRVIAPVELKGANTRDLDGIMPGRHKSPVQQAWEYANDTPGCQFIVVSNMVELRLYAVGHTRQVYERWNILDLADSDAEYQRLQLLLAADGFLSGRTALLLSESGQEEQQITRQLYGDYRAWRIRLIESLASANDVKPEMLIAPAQALLDRVLFIAFAEDRGLLPHKSLEHAYEARNPYAPTRIWKNFKGLFKAIDKGDPELGIPAYNGGLFAHDPALDTLNVPDDACVMFKEIGAYDFASEISVTVLGHIFEQSVTDLEELKELADKLSGKLDDWWTLDFVAFHAEIKKQFKRPIDFSERDQWESRFNENCARIVALTGEIGRCERDINEAVYRLFELTSEEVDIIESSLS